MLLRLFYLLGRQKGNSWKNSQNANRDKMKSTNQWKYMQANKIMLSTILSKFFFFFFLSPQILSQWFQSVVPQTSSTRSQDLVRNDPILKILWEMQIPRLTSDLLNQKLRLGPSRLNPIKLHRYFLSMLKCEKYSISYCQLSEETGNVAFSDCAKHTEDSDRLSD